MIFTLRQGAHRVNRVGKGGYLVILMQLLLLQLLQCFVFGVGDKDAFVFCCSAGSQAFLRRATLIFVAKQARGGRSTTRARW